MFSGICKLTTTIESIHFVYVKVLITDRWVYQCGRRTRIPVVCYHIWFRNGSECKYVFHLYQAKRLPQSNHQARRFSQQELPLSRANFPILILVGCERPLVLTNRHIDAPSFQTCVCLSSWVPLHATYHVIPHKITLYWTQCSNNALKQTLTFTTYISLAHSQTVASMFIHFGHACISAYANYTYFRINVRIM